MPKNSDSDPLTLHSEVKMNAYQDQALGKNVDN
jgi:hypothetical protein